MNEQMRKKINETKNKYEQLGTDKNDKLEDIKTVAQIYQESPIVQELKKLGNEYKQIEEQQHNMEKKYQSQIREMNEYCTHPLLAIISYKKRKENNRIISTSKEEAEYAQLKCLECGKVTFTKDNDKTEDWYNYIHIPHSLVGITKEKYVKRIVIELPKRLSYEKLHKYYEEIMFEQPEEETVQKVLKKISKK